MSRARSGARVLTASLLSAVLALACSGKSESFDDDDRDDESGGTSGSGGAATGGSAPKGGAGPSGGATTGGSSGTGGSAGAPPDGMCDDITPCGGDPTGTWVIRENCTEVVVPGLLDGYPGCENVVTAGSGTLEGTFTFENGIATQSTQQVVDVTVVIDDACAEAISGLPGVTANDLCPLLDAQLMMDATTPTSCAATPDGCRCDGTQMPEPTTQSDTYQVAGNRLLLGTDEEFDFCQQGDEMSLSGSTVDATSGASVDILVILDRQ
jgi:hypothetical protein